MDGRLLQWELHLADTFEIPETVERADWYELFGHPYVVIDGVDGLFGALDCTTAAGNYRGMVQQRLDETESMSPVAITGSWSVQGGSLSLEAVHRVLDPIPPFPLRATFLLYEDGIEWCCGQEEQDVWDRVVRRIRDIPVELNGPGDSVHVAVEIPIEADWVVDNMTAVAYLQGADRDREILQAAVLTRTGTATAHGGLPGSRSGFTLVPNPLRPGGSVSFLVSERAAGSPVRLEMFDSSGRRLFHRHEQDGQPGQQAWGIPALPDGASGITFLRLTTDDGQEVRKILRIE